MSGGHFQNAGSDSVIAPYLENAPRRTLGIYPTLHSALFIRTGRPVPIFGAQWC